MAPTAALSREHPTPVAGLPATDGYFLPAGYQSRSTAVTRDHEGSEAYWSPQRIADSARYQHHVYAWAARLIRANRLTSVLDVGCGTAIKLRNLIAPVCSDIECVDQESAIALARSLGPPGARYTVADLERPPAAHRSFDLIICADVIEHLLNPDQLLEFLRGCAHRETFVLLSTPDRDRRRGRDCRASTKPEHVREWAASEFLRYLRSRGFRVVKTRWTAQDESRGFGPWWQDVLFRMRLRRVSPLACFAVLCRVSISRPTS